MKDPLNKRKVVESNLPLNLEKKPLETRSQLDVIF